MDLLLVGAFEVGLESAVVFRPRRALVVDEVRVFVSVAHGAEGIQ